MKSWLKKNIHTICNACLAYGVFFVMGSYSFFLLGEPEFPVED